MIHHPYCFIILWLLCRVADTTTVVGQQAALVGYPIDRLCQTTADCNDQGYWCRSGQYCLNKRCHMLNNYPCPPAQFCQESDQSCAPQKLCTSHQECDDGIYCNGEEQCVAGRCRNNLTFYCRGCDEANKRCPVSPTTKPTQPPVRPKPATTNRPTARTTIKTNKVGAKTTSPTETPTEAPTSGSALNDSELWFIGFIVAAGVAIIFLFFYVITGAAKPATPSSVILITQNADGEDVDGGNARQLLSTQAYQQKIYYH